MVSDTQHSLTLQSSVAGNGWLLRICVGHRLQVFITHHLYIPYSGGWDLIRQDQPQEVVKRLRCGEDAIAVSRPFPQQWRRWWWWWWGERVTAELCPLTHLLFRGKQSQVRWDSSPGWLGHSESLSPFHPSWHFIFRSSLCLCYSYLSRGSRSSLVVDQVSCAVWSVNPGVECCIQHSVHSQSFRGGNQVPHQNLWHALTHYTSI